MGRVVHFEIPVENFERSMDFYSKVFGWNFQPYGEDYVFASTGKEGDIGIDGALMKRTPESSRVTNAIGVASIDETIAAIEANGCKIVVPKMTVGDMGHLAYFADPDGNVHGIWEPIQQ